MLDIIIKILEATITLCFLVLVPKAEKWLVAKTSAIENESLRTLVTALVESAEQTIKGEGQGKAKKEEVTAELAQLGYELTSEVNAYIESAVRSL